ncbi:MAG TPA: arsenic resistance N-acetyltransferase ArsN2 [Vicinamibacterales bacterium]|nr:arsenic resistance N-acetyltransferase ArsN2 [Vicinamibacterales bacterium]
MDIVVERARPEDCDTIVELLKAEHLPPDGLLDHLDTTLVARQNGHIVGTAALEVYVDGALLRSVAVASALRGRGVGRDLTEAALAAARDLRVPALYLLTTTADNYFPRFGFERITRAEVPASVQASVEFTSACPASAVVMRKQL